MKTRPSPRPRGAGSILGWLSVWLGLSAGLLLAAGPEATLPAGVVHSVSLEYREVPEPVLLWHLGAPPDSGKAVKFLRAPGLSTNHVIRSRLVFQGQTNPGIPYAWDSLAGKLFLDLNGNLDLTDDPTGAFTTVKGRGGQTFTNVHLTLTVASNTYPVLVDLTLYNYGNYAGGYAGVRSYWSGQFTAQAQEWEVGLIASRFPGGLPSPEDHLLLVRPWTQRQAGFNNLRGCPEVANSWGRLFFGGQAYEVRALRDAQLTGLRYGLEFAERQTPLGALVIQGEFLERVFMFNPSGYTVVADAFGVPIQAPIGHYRIGEVWLRKDGAEAAITSQRTLTLKAGETVHLLAGGPLTNSVNLERKGRRVVCRHQIVGAAGDTYRLNRLQSPKPPELTIRQGNRTLLAASFRFG